MMSNTHTLTETVLRKLGVLSVGQGSTPSQEFGESGSWPGRRRGCTSQTYTRRSSVLLQRHNIKADASNVFLFVLQRSVGQFPSSAQFLADLWKHLTIEWL